MSVRFGEAGSERLARKVQRLVRRDVRQACEWDAELEAIDAEESDAATKREAKEERLLELARFEFLSPTEQHIYLANGGLGALDEPAPPPVSSVTRAAAVALVLALIVLPAYFLLAFGVTLGKATNLWLVGTMTCWALGFAIYEPITIFFLNVMLPSLIRNKLKSLVDPAAVSAAAVTFPFRTPLREHATTYLAAKYRDELAAARHLLLRTEGANTRAPPATTDDQLSSHAREPHTATLRAAAAAVKLAGYNTRRGYLLTGGHVVRLLLSVWAIVLLLPEDAQAIVIEDVLMGLTLVASLAQDLVHEIEGHVKVSVIICAALGVLLVLVCCGRSRKLRWLSAFESPPKGADGAGACANGGGTSAAVTMGGSSGSGGGAGGCEDETVPMVDGALGRHVTRVGLIVGSVPTQISVVIDEPIDQPGALRHI